MILLKRYAPMAEAAIPPLTGAIQSQRSLGEIRRKPLTPGNIFSFHIFTPFFTGGAGNRPPNLFCVILFCRLFGKKLREAKTSRSLFLLCWEAHVLIRIISLIFIFLHNNFVKTPWQASALPRGLCLVLVRKILKMRRSAVQIV